MKLTQTALNRSGAGVRVLIVDDNVDAAETLGMLLGCHGYVVDTVVNSTECISHLESFDPDVMLLDIAMPLIDGYALARQIRLHPRFENAIIIATSGYADPHHMQLSFQAGCDQHLVKPFDLSSVEAAIAQTTEKRREHAIGSDSSGEQSA